MNAAKRIGLGFIIPCALLFTGCDRQPSNKCFTCDILMPSASLKPFSELVIKSTNKDMEHYGIEYGDIVEVTATKGNAKWNIDVPYVTSFNEVGTFAPCICDFEGRGGNLCVASGLKKKEIEENNFFAGGKCEVKLKKKRGFKKTRDLAITSRKQTYDECGRSVVKFANARDVSDIGNIGDKIKEKTLHRGSSPISDKKNKERYVYADNYLNYFGIEHDISLSITDQEMETIFVEPIPLDPSVGAYAKSLYLNSKITTINLGDDFFRTSDSAPYMGGTLLAGAFEAIAVSDSEKFYIHCNEGKDRTGFVLLVLEALCGVTINDLVLDYMKTFDNYYNITEVNNKERYDTVANLTCYRNIYTIMAADDLTTGQGGNKLFDNLAEIDMLNFDSKQAVTNKLKDKPATYLQDCAVKYLQAIGVSGDLSSGYIKALHDKFAKQA